MDANKIKTYLGFAMRARKLVLGVNAVQAVRGRVWLLIADAHASENTKKEIESLKKRFACPLLVVDDLEALTGKACCKLAAMREEHLAAAVCREAGLEGNPQGGYDHAIR